MLTNEQIEEKALAHVRRFGADLRLSKPVILADPEAVFYKVERSVSDRSTNLVSPFVVLRKDGQIISISAGDVMPGVVTKLWGWAAMRADPELQMAVIDPDFSKSRHVEVWNQIIREVIIARGLA
ncbi:MAG TPA: hypothetical protein VJ867_09280 [Gemmatimonadaceae bacterium]|nr:hypothetical protein [Gemmatimonadaceae bacterium]